MNRKHEKLSSVIEKNHSERREFLAHRIAIIPFFGIWLWLGTAIISFIVSSVFPVSYLCSFLAVMGTLVMVLSAMFMISFLRRDQASTARPSGGINVSVVAVIGVILMLLAFDFALTLLLSYFAVNVILAHFLIMGLGILLAGTTSVFSQRAPMIVLSVAGGLFTSFLLILMVLGDFEGPEGRSDEMNIVVEVMLILLFVSLLFGASYALVSQAKCMNINGRHYPKS